jgi:hypothetical protein
MRSIWSDRPCPPPLPPVPVLLLLAQQHQRSDSKVLTGKYDMGILREIARIEEACLEELVDMFQVEDEDELPIEFDIHEFVDMDEEARPAALQELLKGCPSPTEDFVAKFCDKIRGLNPKLTKGG